MSNVESFLNQKYIKLITRKTKLLKMVHPSSHVVAALVNHSAAGCCQDIVPKELHFFGDDETLINWSDLPPYPPYPGPSWHPPFRHLCTNKPWSGASAQPIQVCQNLVERPTGASACNKYVCNECNERNRSNYSRIYESLLLGACTKCIKDAKKAHKAGKLTINGSHMCYCPRAVPNVVCEECVNRHAAFFNSSNGPIAEIIQEEHDRRLHLEFRKPRKVNLMRRTRNPPRPKHLHELPPPDVLPPGWVKGRTWESGGTVVPEIPRCIDGRVANHRRARKNGAADVRICIRCSGFVVRNGNPHPLLPTPEK
ncbi:hypothetical protein NA57DRAFT_54545 [Rhizodiscina lignyota]|uniref:Stc1 domain-containing protein n=1 Tax=Rhizodiscina lignyota TaxID=1504668 RepID=A0A9P4IL51_9PEZI|nr:hypothetical protein NA57DRAFT_54545 [Rhizodiscina lignyota]